MQRWTPPTVEGLGPVGRKAVRDKPALPTAEQIQAIEHQARQEGFKAGRAEGLAAGQQAIAEQVHRLQGVMQALARPLEEFDEVVEHELVTLAITIAGQLLRRELKTDPGVIVAVVREALAALPSAARKVTLHLHPDDVAQVREALHVHEDERGWHIEEDPVLSRGGCRVSSETSEVDASVEARLNEIINAVLGGERSEDPAP